MHYQLQPEKNTTRQVAIPRIAYPYFSLKVDFFPLGQQDYT